MTPEPPGRYNEGAAAAEAIIDRRRHYVHKAAL